jgi:putative DNA primase/helicase
MAAVSGMTVDEAVERFIYIDDDTGDFLFDTRTKCVVRAKKMTSLLPPGIRTEDVKRHPLWQQRAVYVDQIGFDPGGLDANVICNRWDGWPTVPKKGDCTVLLELLQFMCSGEANREELYEWVLKWLAFPIQHPGAKMQTCLVVHGPQGTGKSRFFESYGKIFGEYHIILNQGAIEDKFNADWSERKLYVVADEVVANTEKYHLKGQLKNFITSKTVRINPKNVAAHHETNHMNLTFLSNEKLPVVLDGDDRRHCVIWTPPKLGNNFYEELAKEIDAAGISALHDYLLHLDLTGFNEWTWPPMTNAKREVQILSSGSDEQFINHWRMGLTDIPLCPAAAADVYAEYRHWCSTNGESPRPAKFFWANATRLPGWFKGIRDRLENLNEERTVSTVVVIPSDEDMNNAAKRGMVDYRKRDGESRTQWITRGFFAIKAERERRQPNF